MRKNLSMTFLCFLIAQFVMAQNVIGKKFEGEYRRLYACGRSSGCTTIEYCLLDFKKNKVNMSFRSVQKCSDAIKSTNTEYKNDKITTYQWSKKGNKIYIKNFPNGHEEYVIKDDKLLVWEHGQKVEYLPIK